MPLDTLKIAQDLEKEFTPAQAKAIIAVVTRSDLVSPDLNGVREDLRHLNGVCEDLRRTCETIDSRITGESIRLDAKIETQGASIRGEIKEAKLDLIKWMTGALVVNFIGSAGLMITLIRNVKP